VNLKQSAFWGNLQEFSIILKQSRIFRKSPGNLKEREIFGKSLGILKQRRIIRNSI
jgi:hypothetical protein